MRRSGFTKGAASVLAALLFATSSKGLAQADTLPEPDAPNSHAAYAEALVASESLAFAELLARYDSFLKGAPRSVAAAVERCAFIEASQRFGGGLAEREELAGACLADLEERFPSAPEAVLFSLDRGWAEEGIAREEELLEGVASTWSPADRGHLHLAIARKLNYVDLQRAADAAEKAMEENPELDGSVIVAQYLTSQGRDADAAAILAAHLHKGGPADVVLTKARTLAALGELDAAERALRILDEDPDAYVDELARAEVLEVLGRTAEAREIYLAQAEGYLRSQALARLFEIDLERGSSEQALASYEALRDEGFSNDPFLRSRIRLAFAHPFAPWAWRDLLGLLAFVGLLLGVALAPALCILPVHYAGLIRRVRGYTLPEGARWTLKLAWLLSAMFMITDVLSMHAFVPEGAAALFTDYRPPRGSGVQALANYGISTAVLGLGCAAMFLRPADGKFLLRVDWSPSKMIQKVVAWCFLLLIVRAVTYGIARQLSDVDQSVVLLSGASFTSWHVFKAILDTYGLWLLLAIYVVVVPIGGELICRYALLGAFKSHIPQGWANAAQAAVFAFWHDDFVTAPLYFIFGIAAGRLRLQSASLLPSMLLHGLWNLLICLIFVKHFGT